MKKTILIFFVCFLLFLLSSCKKEEVKPKTGGVKITILTNTNVSPNEVLANERVNLNPVEAEVEVAPINEPLRSGNTDANGTVIFEDLNPGNYFYFYHLDVRLSGYVQVTEGITREYTFRP